MDEKEAARRRQGAIEALYERVDAGDWEAALAQAGGLEDETVFRAFACAGPDVPLAVLLRLLALRGVPGPHTVLFQRLCRVVEPELSEYLRSHLDDSALELLARLEDGGSQRCVLALLERDQPLTLTAVEVLSRTGRLDHQDALRRQVETRPEGDPVRRAILEALLKGQGQGGDPLPPLRLLVRELGVAASFDVRFKRLWQLDGDLSVLLQTGADPAALSTAVLEEAKGLQGGWTSVERGLLRDIVGRRCGRAAMGGLGWDDWNYASVELYQRARFKASLIGVQVLCFIMLLWAYRKALAVLLGPLPAVDARAAWWAGALWFCVLLGGYRNDICGFGQREETAGELVGGSRGFWFVSLATPLWLLGLHLLRRA